MPLGDGVGEGGAAGELGWRAGVGGDDVCANLGGAGGVGSDVAQAWGNGLDDVAAWRADWVVWCEGQGASGA